jgi:hypothetical protein
VGAFLWWRLVSTNPPQRSFAERWTLALLIALVFVPFAVAIIVPIVWSAALLWYVSLPLALVALAIVLWVRRA